MTKSKNQNEKRVPELRFKGFSDDWELFKFSTFVKRANKTSNSDSLPKVEFEDIVAGEGRLNKDVSHKFDNRKGIMFNNNNILYGKLRPYLKNWLLPDFKGIALGDFWVLEPIDVDITFLYYLIQSKKFQKVANDTSGTKMPRSDWKKVSNTYFFIPKIEEQKLIGSYIKNLDNAITLYQQKLDKLKLLKKAYLQHMFPEKDEVVPRLRFVYFNYEWEQCKLRDVSTIVSGGTPDTNNIAFWNGDINWFTPAEIGSERYVSSSLRKITKLGLEKSSAKWLPEGTILFTSRAGIGKTAILSRSATTNQGFQSIVPKDDILDSYFIFSMTDYLKKYAEKVGAGSTFTEVSTKQMSSIEISIPNLKEQIKIGSFFMLIDDLIVLIDERESTIINIKQSLLDKMFV
ncbi:restriction endonuclease subunit S [Fundicoccus culcitae]|uniref:Restriction endonuclease subunit S n=1 Tax=Fundicoccus culcitae TaxID=2969821 RepID=A0ABY5P806_9LACT|nr:restriction endonuclease subunit S [Fundicoccus culcitae]UUX34720.1 restriction endonuclease subunit S [Fundicoccus culcitae]